MVLIHGGRRPAYFFLGRSMFEKCEYKIQSRDFRIVLKEAIQKILDNKIVALRFDKIIDVDGHDAIRVIGTASVEVDSKKWHRIHCTKSRMFTRTPSILKQYAGNSILHYHQFLDKNADELFRVKPISFNLGDEQYGSEMINPLITKMECLVLPIPFLVSNSLDPERTQFISFDITDNYSIENGLILGYFSMIEMNSMHYRLNKSRFSYRTKRLKAISDLVGQNGKITFNYTYHKFMRDENYPHGIIAFRENIKK
jgi:hypothetical protein